MNKQELIQTIKQEIRLSQHILHDHEGMCRDKTKEWFKSEVETYKKCLKLIEGVK